MLEYELLLSARTLLIPRQLRLEVSAVLSGAQLATVLDGQVPGTRWYAGSVPLEELGQLAAGGALLLADVPGPGFAAPGGGSRLKLFVADGPDAGACMELSRGTHEIGRAAPLRLSDPRVSRVHARLVVDERSIRVQAAGGQRLVVLSEQGSSETGGAELRAGSRIQLGRMVLAVGDPARSAPGPGADDPQLEFSPPQPPELGRLVTLCAAALVPVLSGALLAMLTGSMLFLAISGLSALLGVIPAGQLLGERRRWKRLVREQQRSVVQARERYACPLGASLVAGIEQAALGVLPAGLPPLVFGRGSWQVPARDNAPRRTPGRALRHHRARAGRGAARFTDVPVFAAARAEVWQILGGNDPAAGSLLAAVLARFLPQLSTGRLELVIDPSLTQLPAELMLLRHARQGTAQQLAGTAGMELPAAGLPGLGATASAPGPGIARIFLTRRPPQPLARTLVISLDPVLSAQSEYWVDPVNGRAKLPESNLSLDSPAQLDAGRLARLIQSCLALDPHTSARAPFEPMAPEHGLAAVLGEDDSHERLLLDFEADGPHVLLCGTTGSGKSEALRRVIADLAGRYSPGQLAFALVDFKGGAGLAVFDRLPHVQLSASDLDAAGAQRTLAQLEREVMRRERLLADHRCSDRNEYAQLSGVPQLPRLLVVVDEFRVFAESLPEAAGRIDRLAAVGRSLGIHLLLSTQRAAGALNGQTRANLNTIIALRVKDAAESMELVGTAAAARLGEPGRAIMAGPGQRPRPFRFALAVSPALYGSIAERGPGNLTLHPVGSFGHPDPAADGLALQHLVRSLAERWDDAPLPLRPFAPRLPAPGTPDPGASSRRPDAPGAIYCGVSDDLAAGRLEDLVIDPARGRGLLVCGVPEAGGRQLFERLAGLDRQVLCFGAAPVADPSRAPGLRTATGEDPHLFAEALDYLQSLPDERALLVLVHGTARLQSLLDPGSFQRLDQVLTELLHRGSRARAQLVVLADRDLNLLKAASLCAEQWYFPLNATDALRMSWPKLPAASQLPGRGVRFSPAAPPTTIQLTSPRAKPASQRGAASFWAEPRAGAIAARPGQFAVGRTAFAQKPFFIDASSPVLMICPREADRAELPELLAERWNAVCLRGQDQWLGWIESAEAESADSGGRAVCVVLDGTGSAQVAALYQRAAALDSPLVLFVPPSPRLAYDLGVPGMMLDDRQVLAVEASHPQDLQPMAWPPLPPAPGEDCTARAKRWRAIASIAGQPRAIIIGP